MYILFQIKLLNIKILKFNKKTGIWVFKNLIRIFKLFKLSK